MADVVWRGDAQAIAQVTDVTFTSPAAGRKFTLTINSKSISVTSTDTSIVTLVEDFVTAIGNSQATTPEWSDVTPTAAINAAGLAEILRLTGPAAGKPFTVTQSATASTVFGVEVRQVVQGSASANAKYELELPSAVSGGTFTVSGDGETTGTIAWNASVATFQAAMDAVTNWASQSTVSGSTGGPWTIEWTGATYAGVDLGVMSASGASLTLTTPTINITRETQGGVTNEEWTLTRTASSETGDAFQLSLTTNRGSGTTAVIPASATGAEISAIIERSSFIQEGDVGVSGVSGGPWTFSWDGVDVGINLTDDPISVSTYNRAGTALTPVATYATTAKVADGGTTVAEVQLIVLDPIPASGNFTLTHSGNTTGSLAATISAASLDTALVALGSISAVTVTKPNPGVWSVQFDDSTIEPLMTGADVDLAGAVLAVNKTQSAVVAVNEVQEVEITGGPAGGTFTLTHDYGAGGETTAGVAYNATADTLQTAIEALTTPVSGDIEIDGPAGGPYLITFQGNFAGTDEVLITGSAASLTGGTGHAITLTSATTAQSPNHASVAANYSGGALPVNSDRLIFEKNTVDCIYGLDSLSAVTLTELVVRKSYTGRIGLPEHNGQYYEYLPTFLEVGATTLTVGAGEGQGSPRLKFNTGSVQATLQVTGSGRAEGEGEHAIEFKGTHTSNVVRINRGDLGIGTVARAAATVATLAIGYIDDQNSDVTVEIGENATLTTIDKTGGSLLCYSAATTITQTAGTTEFDGAITTLNALGGSVFVTGTGTITTLNVAPDTTVSFDKDTRARTVTNTTIQAGATVRDNFATVTFTNDPALDQCGFESVTLELGTGLTFSRTKT